MIDIVYLVQIGVLLGCMYMTWKIRQSINGLARGLLLLFLLLILRRLDDMLQLLDALGLMVLSSAVVFFVAYDIYQIYKARDLYAFYFKNRQERISALEVQFHKRSDEP